MTTLRGERGSTSVLILGLSIALLVGVGFAVDGSRKGQAYSQATSIAEEAARAGGQALRARALAEGTDADVDPQLAVVEAQHYITASGVRGTARWEGRRLVVGHDDHQVHSFLGSIGISEFTVHGTGSAVVVSAG